MTRAARINPTDSLQNPPPNKGPAQVMLNDSARLFMGIRRAKHYRAVDLSDRSGLPTVNEIVVRQSAIVAWRASNGNTLQDVLEKYEDRTRGASGYLRKPVSQCCLPAVNMCTIWNSCEALRKADLLTAARSIARKISKEARHA